MEAEGIRVWIGAGVVLGTVIGVTIIHLMYKMIALLARMGYELTRSVNDGEEMDKLATKFFSKEMRK